MSIPIDVPNFPNVSTPDTVITRLPTKYSPTFTDEHEMPFGKYADEAATVKKLKDVPANYLLWLYQECSDPLRGYAGKQCLSNMGVLIIQKIHLANYIYNSRNALNVELRKFGKEIK